MRKLLSTIGVVTAFALFAAPAMASESLSAVTEPGGGPCTTTCIAEINHISGLVELTGHIFGFPVHVLDCTHEYTMRINANASGTISNSVFGQGDANCVNIVSCNAPWTFSGEETRSNGFELLAVMCFDTPSLGRCAGAIDIQFDETAYGSHLYRGSAVDQRVGSTACEVTGTWSQGNGANFEMVHQ